MSAEPLFLPRRLAIRLLAEAQKSPDGQIRGWVGAKNLEPVSVYPASANTEVARELRDRDETVWAVYRSRPAAAGAPASGELADAGARFLGVSIDTKGVLQLRCWEVVAGKPVEQILKIRD